MGQVKQNMLEEDFIKGLTSNHDESQPQDEAELRPVEYVDVRFCTFCDKEWVSGSTTYVYVCPLCQEKIFATVDKINRSELKEKIFDIINKLIK